MISFDGFKLEDGIPIYLQIIMYIKRGVVAGNICDGDELPSRRMLSALLGVNPNTVQKAYSMLEEDLIQSHSGAKSCVVLDEGKIEKIRAELIESDVKGLISSMRHMGVSKKEALEVIERYWEGEI